MNLAEFLRSAYHQELFPEYRARDPLFLPSMRQSESGLWLRGAASMGWAAGYAVEGNPFTGHPSALKGLFYLLDGLIGGIGAYQCVSLINEGTPEKILPGLLAMKAGHSVLSLAIFTPLLSIELGETLRIRNTGYRFPKTLYLEGRPPRFRDD